MITPRIFIGASFILILSFLVFFHYSNQFPSYVLTFAFETQSTNEVPSTAIGYVTKAAKAGPIHQDITKEALPFIESWVLDEVNKAHQFTDFQFKNQFNPAFHFDNCQFSSSTQKINTLYDEILATLNPGIEASPNIIKAAREFGMLLHISQDFYSHSNWVEMGRTDLIDKGYDKWTVLKPYAMVEDSNVVVIEGDKLRPDFKLSRDPTSKVVTVNGNYNGLISGLALSEKGCPSSVAIGHYDSSVFDQNGSFIVFSKTTPELFRLIQLMQNLGIHFPIPGFLIDRIVMSQYQYVGNGLSKDNPSLPLFANAKDLAIQQTQHEWCRLVSLLSKEYANEEAKLETLFEIIVSDKSLEKSITNCLPTTVNWKGNYSDDVQFTYSNGNVDKFNNTGSFTFTIRDDYSIKGIGNGLIHRIFSGDLQPSYPFSFSVNGFYDSNTDTVRLKFSGFSKIHQGFDSVPQISSTILYGFHNDPKLINLAKLTNHGPLCSEKIDPITTMKEFGSRIDFDTDDFVDLAVNDIGQVGPMPKEWLPLLYGWSFNKFYYMALGDPAYDLCKNPELDISFKNRLISIIRDGNPYQGLKYDTIFSPNLGTPSDILSDSELAPLASNVHVNNVKETHQISICPLEKDSKKFKEQCIRKQ